MLSAYQLMRIKANAQVFGVDLTTTDDMILFKIARAAKANEWALVESYIREVVAA